MAKKDFIEMDGDVIEVFRDGSCNVKLENGMSVVAHMSGKIKLHRIKILKGDLVRTEISPYDLTRGRITFRYNRRKVALEAAAKAKELENSTEESSNDSEVTTKE